MRPDCSESKREGMKEKCWALSLTNTNHVFGAEGQEEPNLAPSVAVSGTRQHVAAPTVLLFLTQCTRHPYLISSRG